MKKFFAVLIIILVIILIGLGFYFRGYLIYLSTGKITRSFCESNLTPKILGVTNQGEIDGLKYGYKNNGNLDLCLEYVAYHAKNPKLCSQVINPQEKDTCFWRMGVLLNRPELCGEILNGSMKINCINKK